MGAKVHISELTKRLRDGKTILGIAITPSTSEISVIRPPYSVPRLIRTGKMLDDQELLSVATEQDADSAVLGGSAAFRADGSIHFGVRKMISRIIGLEYQGKCSPVPIPNMNPDSGFFQNIFFNPSSPQQEVRGKSWEEEKREDGIEKKNNSTNRRMIPVFITRELIDDPCEMILQFLLTNAPKELILYEHFRQRLEREQAEKLSR
uniref:Uncharacterized protein n=1 Tax=Polytomella parva TaxID=51329 RepID=A0A7S0UTJ5_9CHLO|mmetsp:Transcript_2141/g.3228  ORF Transcript_2141/g.3228 Transcript_2141/m.3228 type:complete len:206 (+) Transcript_2141:114-731(+)|eukprot:CAMPEP_0175075348 /NCGR_PEP_ID=MMETSP0052_2-20121109/21944_1 /TAXON_ID=51329 ORGANISM="Polytomella parva, Strain SAG 63-3" /NCGR_SAMPLE_ID=MMETSP0052_2 /ASSEMBLY_ACC=CAM_ASM_000194 /LENGTH=205 /DNA_ID=CAMNT_0016344011 /DNA_START=36 /DNA_END=653 /DNA_ORIENTATION=+